MGAVMALCLYGLVMVCSATRGPEAEGLGPLSEYARRQALWIGLGVLALIVVTALDYEAIARWHVPAYGVVTVLLAAVLKVGHAPTGASSWMAVGAFRLQPSELAKVAVVLSLAGFVSRRIEEVRRPGVVLGSLAIAAAPVALVVVQPDFGTALVVVAIWFGVLYLAGARGRHLAAVLVCGLALFALMWNLDRAPLERMRPAPVGRALAKLRLKDYQKRRLTIFLHPQADPLGAGYHVIQSRLAVGSGQLIGRGLFRGTQSRLRFIPERHTDFIFAVVGEELGLAGAAGMLLLYFFLFWRGLRVALRARDALGSLLAAGAVSMLLFHTIVNIGMAVRIMPITGIPLPFVSYGGSNMLASFLALGLLQNAHMRRDRIVF